MFEPFQRLKQQVLQLYYLHMEQFDSSEVEHFAQIISQFKGSFRLESPHRDHPRAKESEKSYIDSRNRSQQYPQYLGSSLQEHTLYFSRSTV